MRIAGNILGRMLLCPYRVMTNFYRERILPMQMAGCMQGRMQYAPTGSGIISTEKEYYPCG